MREGLNRPWLVLVLAAFGIPLFIGLGSIDLGNDEAIYSYAVESILTTGDWLSPHSSPYGNVTFLEKPPLKFWIVAAPIRFGLLPHNEFGMRFWDAVFGAAAFVYVFLLGARLAGPLCGVVAGLVLFAHSPLIFDHGLRSNNMDAALLLAYSGGVYHYLRWGAGDGTRPGSGHGHIAAVAALFFLAFMTKFVAALFLPAVLGLAAVIVPEHRRQLILDWRRWVVAAALVIACAAPWFIYQYALHGDWLPQVMFGEHVYTRFTQFTDPTHVRPWHFYLTSAYQELTRSGSLLWVGLGLVVLFVHLVRRRTPESLVIAIWMIVPVTIISLGSSKLYHYLYPYLPPLGLAAGAGVAWIAGALRQPLAALEQVPWRVPPRMRTIAWGISGLALVLALATIINDGVRIYAGEALLFRNTSVMRPLLAAAIGVTVAAGLRVGALLVAVLLIQAIVPTPLHAYAGNLRRLNTVDQSLATLARCVREVDARRGGARQEIYAPVRHSFIHPYFYYLRGSGWLSDTVDESRVRAALGPGGEMRPVALDDARYLEFRATGAPVDDRLREVPLRGVIVALPGDYAVCAERSSAGR